MKWGEEAGRWGEGGGLGSAGAIVILWSGSPFLVAQRPSNMVGEYEGGGGGGGWEAQVQ